MDSISDGCRLCLDPFAECFTTIDNPQLKGQMEKVFWFLIEPKQGYCSGVCSSCSYAISEFWQYSEKVRLNQEVLNGNVTNCDPTIDSKDALKSFKVETLSDSVLPEAIEDASQAKDEVAEEEEFPTVDSIITLKRVKVETLSDSALPGTKDDACEPKDEILGEEEDPSLDSKITIDCINVETISDSGLPETADDAWARIDEVSGEEGPNSGDDESYEPSPKISQTKRKGQLDAVEIDSMKTTNNKQKLNEQDQLFNKHISMVCDLCGTSAVTFTELCNHFRTEHKRPNGYVVCCNKKLFRRCAIRDHINFHANPHAFRCEVCGNKYMTKDTLKRHMLFKHSSEDQGPLQCDHCPQSFAKKSVLAQHMERHVKVKCPKCDKMFASKNSLYNHMTDLHSGKNRKMVCNTCGKEFLTKKHFNRHMNQHMGIEEKHIQCGICHRWFKGEDGLRYHMNTVHTNADREFQCDICPQKFPHPRALYHHKLYQHTDPKHECEFCGKKFRKAIALKEHRATHTGEVLYTCEYCGTPIRGMSSLYKHIKQQHPVEWAQRKLVAHGVSEIKP